MKRPLIDRDTGDETLFDVNTTLPKTCSCGCTAKNLCPIDAAIANGGVDKWATRPRTCLSRHDPSTAPLPEGY